MQIRALNFNLENLPKPWRADKVGEHNLKVRYNPLPSSLVILVGKGRNVSVSLCVSWAPGLPTEKQHILALHTAAL